MRPPPDQAVRKVPPPREHFWQSLACAALDEELRSVVVLDATYDTLRAAAREWAAMLGAVVGCTVETVWLGSVESDDELWGRPAMGRGDDGTTSFGWRSGRLYPPPDGLRLVVIRDLPRLSLAAARACVALVGASAAALERHGRHHCWTPRLAWLAGLRRAEAGEISPHLLDRFALRLSAPPRPPTHTGAAIHAWVHQAPPNTHLSDSRSDLDLLARATQRHLAFATETTAAVASYFPAPGEGMRRELSLARMARAVARLDDAAVVTPDHLRAAAAMVGLKTSAEPLVPTPPSQSPAPAASRLSAFAAPAVCAAAPGEEALAPEPMALESETVWQGEAERELVRVALPSDPYPEDEAPVLRDFGSLRIPPRAGARDDSRGQVTGTEPAGRMHDLAVVETIMEALKHRPLRRARGWVRPLICRGDLRSYRRAATPEHMLVVVVDFTALPRRNWEDALLPHLTWAYVKRARVRVVRIGAAGARSALRAEAVDGRNLLAASVEAALTAAPGQATPLAHGMDLAVCALRPALQHGRARVRHARLVVASDGRGNVPLAASRGDEFPAEPVYDQGVRDALEVAREIRSLRGVEAILLDPRPTAYPTLPTLLAQALAARVEPIGRDVA